MEIKKNGGMIIAESEETAVVYGMPKEIISAGLADAVAPLYDIPKILRRFT